MILLSASKANNFAVFLSKYKIVKLFKIQKKIAKIFNYYFVNIAGKTASEIPRTKKSPLDYLGDKLGKSLFLSPTNSC